MSELEKKKIKAIIALQDLCIRCREGVKHNCPIVSLIKHIEEIRGVPVIVNDRLYHVVFN